MATATVMTTMSFPARAVWDCLSWEGSERLVGGALFKGVEFEQRGSEIGSIKTWYLDLGLPIRERLEWIDGRNFAYRYRVIDDGSLPVTDYEGYVRVTPCGPEACHVKIESQYTPVDVDEATWRTEWTRMETLVLDDVKRRLSRT